MDYVQDRAKIMGDWVDLEFTSAGHYCLSLDADHEGVVCNDEEVFAVFEGESEERKRKMLLKCIVSLVTNLRM